MLIESAKAKIVLPNGTSSSGKSTIATSLQSALRDPAWLLLSLDDALRKLPEHAFETHERFAANVMKIIPGFHRSVVSFARSGTAVRPGTF